VISLTTAAARALMPVLVRYESFVASVVQLQQSNYASVYIDYRVLFLAARHIAFSWLYLAYVHRHSNAPSQFDHIRYNLSLDAESDEVFVRSTLRMSAKPAVYASQCRQRKFRAGARASRCACVIPAHVLELNSPARHSMRRPTDRTSSHLKYRGRSIDKRFGNE